MPIRKRGNSYMVDVKVGAKDNPTNQPVRIRVTVHDEKLAKKREAEIRAAIMTHGTWNADMMVEGVHGNAKRKVIGTLGDALEEAWSYPSGRKRGWKFQRTGTRSYQLAKMCVDFFDADRMCASIKSEDIDRLVSYLTAQNLASDSINTYIQPFYRVLWHAQRKGWVVNRPIWERLAPGRPRQFIFTEELVVKVTDYFRDIERDPRLADLFVLGIETGMRLNELLRSRVKQWDLKDRLVYIPHEHSKSGVGRYVTLTDEAIAIITPLVAGQDEEHRIFPMSDLYVQHRIRKARTFCGMEDNKDFVFHACRHTRATRLARKTRDPFVVMAQLGHSNINISMRYIKMVAMNIE